MVNGKFGLIDKSILTQGLSLVVVYVKISSIALSSISLFWIGRKLLRSFGLRLSEKKHLFMTLSLIACLTSFLYTCVVSFAIESTFIHLGIFFLFNGFTFFIVMITLILEMIRPEFMVVDEDSIDDSSSGGLNKSIHEIQPTKESNSKAQKQRSSSNSRLQSKDCQSDTKFIDEFARTHLEHLNEWSRRLEGLQGLDSREKTSIQQLVEEMRSRTKVLNFNDPTIAVTLVNPYSCETSNEDEYLEMSQDSDSYVAHL
ncbi:hypothetical protein M3Y94_01117300 [Aphelenchoides besseyi]|nr:hypothetical protein M3Y94_01117300 [Aphelenchoides besseyi]